MAATYTEPREVLAKMVREVLDETLGARLDAYRDICELADDPAIDDQALGRRIRLILGSREERQR